MGFNGTAKAQGISPEDLYTEIVYLQGLEHGSGGRALALGGAYRALSDDLSGLYWNPAGLAAVRRIEISLGLSQSNMQDEAGGFPQSTSNSLSRSRLNEAGVVFPFPTYRGSLVFALGYQQVHSFDYFGVFKVRSDSLDFSGEELVSGRLGLWSLGAALDVSERVSVGMALRLWTGYKDQTWNALTSLPAQEDSTHAFSDETDLSGFNVMLGLGVRPMPWLRFGATLETPLRLGASEAWQESFAGASGDSSFAAHYDYHVSRSFRFGVGAAVLAGPVGISADVLLTDWSQISFGDEPPALYQDQANREITKQLHATVEPHVGLEYWLPILQGRLQAGYAYIPSPFVHNAVISSKQVLSGGFGILLDPSLYLQTSLSWATWERQLGGWSEDLRLAQFLITISCRI